MVKINTRDASGLGLGVEFTVAVVLGLGVGYWLDRKLGTSPWITMVGLVYGAAAGFRFLYRAAKKSMRDSDREDAEEAERVRDEAERTAFRESEKARQVSPDALDVRDVPVVEASTTSPEDPIDPSSNTSEPESDGTRKPTP